IDDRRGSHLALSLERLEALAAEARAAGATGAGARPSDVPAGRSPAPPLIRIGCSATQRPIEEAARFLVGVGGLEPDGAPRCAIVDSGHARDLDLRIEVPRSPLQAVMSNEVWEEVYDRLAALIQKHQTTLVFVNTRRLAERLSRQLSDRLGEERVTAHHGSMSRAHRLDAEQRLKGGRLRALVATASLELGIDIGSVDLVCQIGTTRSIATLLQRVGRSGHSVGGFPVGRLFPLTRDELVECAALLDSVRRGELDRLSIPEAPLDILAQQIVAAVCCQEWRADDLYDMTRRAYPYRSLPRERFDDVVDMLADGFSVKRGRRAAFLFYDRVNGRLRARKGARLAAITSGGAIPDTADYTVVLEPEGTAVGSVNEDFAIESMAGDIFQLGNTSWRILKIEPGKVRVEDARGQPPGIPFWVGEAPARTAELSAAVSRLREEVERRLDEADGPADRDHPPARRFLETDVGLAPEAAEQIVDYLAAARAALGVVPSQKTIVLERFFDESGGMQLVLHSPFGRRINFAWGLALRKRFCRNFNIELQAAATEDAIVLSLGPSHSFPLEDVFRYLRSGSVREVLVQALLDAPMFGVRWRWNATRSLAILRFRGGRKVAPQLQRMQAEDLIAAVFPDQIACAENLTGERRIPDHPLVQQTIRDCLEEAMDLSGLEWLLGSIERGERTLVARDTREPSPLAQEVLTARPYAFLDDAPLEERRTQAVVSRRWLDPVTATDLGTLDPAAIRRVRDEAWPVVTSADELQDALEILGFVTEQEGRTGVPEGIADVDGGVERASGAGWERYLGELIAERRAAVLCLHPDGAPPAPSETQGARAPIAREDGLRLWVAAGRLPDVLAAFPTGVPEPLLAPPSGTPDPARELDRDAGPGPASEAVAAAALVEIVRGRLEGLGPVTAEALAKPCDLPGRTLEQALLHLESEGFVLRGRFTPGVDAVEWCARGLLARIHRYTLDRLRSEVEPVNVADFMRFLLSWQRVSGDDRVEGPESLRTLVEMLEGFEAPAAAWEGDILPARLTRYDPSWLDALCLSGRVVWARVSPSRPAPDAPRASGPVRSTPIALLLRGHLPFWASLARRAGGDATFSSGARAILELLSTRGALFFDEIAGHSGFLKTQVENALAELVARGAVTSDGFTGLRALITPSGRRRPLEGSASRSGRGGRRFRSTSPFGMESAGRWTVLWIERPAADASGPTDGPTPESIAEAVAPVLLRRYGVVFRRLLDREGPMPPWRDLLRVYRRMEARGEIRGGRFVSGVQGEQFARPEAVERLRAIRRAGPSGALVAVSAADPLNLVGHLVPGPRVAAAGSSRILYRDGVPIAVREAGEVRFLVDLDQASAWRARNALLKRAVPPQLRAYLGHTA
ncbi:MAG: ATP-dependent DNA helicase, partial [Acidobacteria bacterium]